MDRMRNQHSTTPNGNHINSQASPTDVELPTSERSDVENSSPKDQTTTTTVGTTVPPSSAVFRPISPCGSNAPAPADIDDDEKLPVSGRYVKILNESQMTEDEGMTCGTDIRSYDDYPGDDEKSVPTNLSMSAYPDDEAISFVESCSSSSLSTLSDLSSSSCSEDGSEQENDDGKSLRKRKRSSSTDRRRRSNSDSDDDDDEEESGSDSGNDTPATPENKDVGGMMGDQKGGVKLDANESTKGTKATSTSKIASVWDVDGYDEVANRRSSNPGRKLWSDFTYKPHSDTRNSSKPRPGSRFTNSFSDDKSGAKGTGTFPCSVPAAQGWGGSQGLNSRFPTQGLGLGRGLIPDSSKRYDSYGATRQQPSPSGWQSRRPNNPYGHYQQQQRYFGMPRGTYASVVQKGPKNGGGGSHQDDREFPGEPYNGPTRRKYNGPTTRGRTGAPTWNNIGPKQNFSNSSQREDDGVNYMPTQQSYHQEYYAGQQKQHQQQQPPQYKNQQHQKQPQQASAAPNSQSYNRGTVTAAQILQQQRKQQTVRQQATESNKQDVRELPPRDKKPEWSEWHPPEGAFAMMIGQQQVYVIQPSGNRPPIAQEDPAVIRAEPPTPQPYIVLPGGFPLSLNPGVLIGDCTANGVSGPRNDKHITESVLRNICSRVHRPIRQQPTLFNHLPNMASSHRSLMAVK